MHPRRFVRDTLGFAGSQYLARALLIARGIVAAAVLGPSGYGGWNALQLIFDYGAYSPAGSIQGLDLRLPAAVESGDRAGARAMMGAAWAVVVAGGLAFAGLVAVDVALGGRAFSSLPGRDLPLLMLAVALLQLPFQYLASALRAHGRIQAVSGAHAWQAILGAGLGLALVGTWGLRGLMLGWMAGTVVVLIGMTRRMPEAPLAPRDWSLGRSLVATGFPMFGFFATTLVLRSADRLALAHLASPEALGLYGVGLMAGGLVLYPPEAVAYVLLPRMAAAAQGARDPERTEAETIRAQRALTLLLPGAAAVGLAWAEPVLARLLPAFVAGLPAVLALSVAGLVLAAATLPAYDLLARGRHSPLLAIGAMGACANLVLLFAVAARDPRPGVVGAATAAGDALFALAVLVLATRTWRLDGRARWGLIATSLGPALVGGALAVGACTLWPGASIGRALLRTVAIALGYAPMLWALGRGLGLRTLAREWRS